MTPLCRPSNCKVTHTCALYWPTDKPWPKGVPLMDGIAVTRMEYAIWPITCVFFQDKEKRDES